MRFLSPYHKGVRIQHGGERNFLHGYRYQTGNGFVSLLKGLWTVVAPLVRKGVKWLAPAVREAGKLSKREDVKTALRDLGGKTVVHGLNAINKAVNPSQVLATKERERSRSRSPSPRSKKRKKSKAAKKRKRSRSRSPSLRSKKKKKPRRTKNKNKNKNNIIKKKKKNKGKGPNSLLI
jgi:hypothetical protein